MALHLTRRSGSEGQQLIRGRQHILSLFFVKRENWIIFIFPEIFSPEEHTCINAEDLHNYVIKVMETQSAGVSVSIITNKFNSSSNYTLEFEDTGTKWDIPSAILFCITVISTIGEYAFV